MKIFKIYGVIFPKARFLCFLVSSSNNGLFGDQDSALEWHTSTLCARQAHTYHELDKKFNSKINLIYF